jgi:hypothetical protein
MVVDWEGLAVAALTVSVCIGSGVERGPTL